VLVWAHPSSLENGANMNSNPSAPSHSRSIACKTNRRFPHSGTMWKQSRNFQGGGRSKNNLRIEVTRDTWRPFSIPAQCLIDQGQLLYELSFSCQFSEFFRCAYLGIT